MMVRSITVGSREVGEGCPCFLIAEVGLAHDGSLGTAHAYIDAVAECGVDAVKFQTHIAEEESTIEEAFRVNVFPQDATRYDYWKRTGFNKKQWQELAAHTRELGLFFLSSPFSNLAVEWLEECDVPAWKIASGEVTNIPMIDAICETGKPVLLSSGMSTWKELDDTTNLLAERNVDFGLFQCTTAYPCPPEKWGLNVISEMASRYQCPIGLSDHSGKITPGIAAVARGASMLEFHVAFSKEQFGPDSKASLTFDQVRELATSVREIHIAMQNPIDKDFQAQSLSPLRDLFTKSIVAATDLVAGHEITMKDLAFKKPGTGWKSNDIGRMIGRRLRISVRRNHFFSIEDFHSS